MAKKKISAAEWLKRLQRAKKFRDQVKDKQGWDRILDEYKGDYKINNQSIRAVPINLVFGYVHTAIPKLYFRDPYITVNAKGGQYIQRAHLLEIVVNYLAGELGLKKEITKVLMDAILVGHGWLKYGYSGQFESSKDENPTEAPVSNVDEYVKNEEIFVCYVPWEDVLFDVTLCKDPPYDCRWIAHRIIKPVEAFKDSSIYKNTENIKSNLAAVDSKGAKIDESLKDSDLDLFEAWEIRDKDSNQILVVAEGSDQFLREDQDECEMEGLPFSMLKFNPIPGEPYPLSDITVIEPQILERIKLRSAQVNHIKRWSRQLSVEKGAMTNQEIEKFSQGIDGAVTQREKGSAPPVPIQYAPLQAEIFVLDDLIQRDMDAVIGQNDVERGGQARTTSKTKYELEQQQVGLVTRSAKRQDTLEDFLEEVFRKIIQLLKQYQTTPKYVAITGMSPDQVMQKLGLQSDGSGVKFTRENIQGDFDVDAKAGSTLPMNKENRIKVMDVLLQHGPLFGIVPGSPVATAIAKEYIREMDLKEAEQAFEEQENAMKQQNDMRQAVMARMQSPGGAPAMPMPAAPQGAPIQPPLA